MVRAFLGLIRTPPEQRDSAAIQAFIDRAVTLALLLENHLQDLEFVTGSQLTMGDISLWCAANCWLGLPIEHPPTTALSAWYRRIMTRPATQGVLTLPLA